MLAKTEKHRFPLFFFFTDDFVAFNYRNLEPRQLEPKATEDAALSCTAAGTDAP